MLRFIDLFSGMGGMRLGLELACKARNVKTKCVFTSEIKKHAIDIYRQNFNAEEIFGDITNVDENSIPDFDVLLGGFPCQSFSAAGKRHGFNDTRGTLFFDILRILEAKKPSGFILENVAGLVTHDKEKKDDKIGLTLAKILSNLQEIGYKLSWRVLDSQDFGVPQKRERVYILGHLENKPNLDFFTVKKSVLKDIMEQGLPTKKTLFTKKLLELYGVEHLKGKSIKDKRGGDNNIHSWDLELKGKVSLSQKRLMSLILKQRRQKKWAIKKNIAWMDGMPLTTEEIHSFYNEITVESLQIMLDDLVEKKYLKYEHPKELRIDSNENSYREEDVTKDKGYNIVAGKLSFEFTKILDTDGVSNTLVATEVNRIAVIDGDGIRNLSNRECLRLFGFPESYSSNIKQSLFYDLIGNTVVVPVVEAVMHRLLDSILGNMDCSVKYDVSNTV